MHLVKKLSTVGTALLFALIAKSLHAEPAPALPVEAFGTLPFIAQPVLSPDGTHMALRAKVGGSESLVVLSLTNPNEPRYTLPTAGRDLRWIKWANDNRLLVSIGMQEKFVNDLLYITRLLAIDRDGKNIVVLGQQGATQLGDRYVYLAPKNADSILMPLSEDIYTDPDVYKIDLKTGKGPRIVPHRQDIRSWYADADGVVRFGFGYDTFHNTRTVIYRRSADESFRTIEKVEAKQESNLVPVLFTADPNIIIVQSSERTGREALYEYSISDKKLGREIYSHPSVDVEDIILSADHKSIAGVRYTDDQPRVHWLDLGLKSVQEDIDKKAPGTSNEIVSLSADLTRMIVMREGPTHPNSYYYYDSRNGQLQLLGKAYERLDNAVLAETKRVDYFARDGLRIPAYLTLPAGRNPRDLPFILMPHGGPWARDALGFDYWAQLLANRGYAVLQPNYRGSTGYGDYFTSLGTGEWGKTMQDDLEDAFAWAVEQHIADPGRACIFGGSYGGYAALMGAVKTPEFFRCAVSLAGVSDIEKLQRYDKQFLYHKTWRQAVDPNEMKKVSPIYLADRFSKPLLLVHGTKDISVPYEQSETLVKALTKAGKAPEFVTLKDGDHHLSREDHRLQFLKVADAFLAKHNPTDGAPSGAAAPPSLAVLMDASSAWTSANKGEAQAAVDAVGRALTANTFTPSVQADLRALRARQLDQRLNRGGDAAADYAAAIALAPKDLSLHRAYAWLLATSPEASVRDGRKAVTLATEVVAKTSNSGTLQVLAAAYAESGDMTQASATQQKAMDQLGDVSAKTRGDAQERLTAYQAGKPWHRAAATGDGRQEASNTAKQGG